MDKEDTHEEALEAGRRQLLRLNNLTDCVYAVAIVVVLGWLPLPEEVDENGPLLLWQLFGGHLDNLIAALIGLVFIVVYWLRSNALTAHLDRTDGVHTAFTIVQVFFLLSVLYIVQISTDLSSSGRRAGESAAVALTGLAAAGGWWHARRADLVRRGVSAQTRTRVQIEAFAEPAVALLTLPIAFIGELSWNLSWLLYIPIARLLRRKR